MKRLMISCVDEAGPRVATIVVLVIIVFVLIWDSQINLGKEISTDDREYSGKKSKKRYNIIITSLFFLRGERDSLRSN